MERVERWGQEKETDSKSKDRQQRDRYQHPCPIVSLTTPGWSSQC